ncbi:MAG: DMT family transporter [Pelagibacteraceae bacterium]|nr:DMT family transporter [Pelagibacteraceae bacterium]MBO6484087.1 DMT family transporter [Pelagibacteraceae bacterium]MBO6484790.1 DMT family transporter [Pelagibacteraceae bacterium]MBO6488723.1 DMT family transporter [Pelagibacteraceae bacterium]
MSKNILGLFYMLISVTFFSLMDVLVKVTGEYALGEILFFRSLFGLIPIFFLIPKNRLKNFYKTQKISLHFYRSLFGTIAMASIFIALRNLELAETVAMTFAGPIFVTLFSIFFLSEKVRLTRWSAVVIGFIGVIFISRPGFETANIFYIFPIIFCLGFAAVCILIRKLTLYGESVWLIAFYFTLVSGLAGLATLPFGGWLIPTKIDFILLALIGIFGSVANLLLTQSYKLAEVSLTTPLKYLALIYAIAFGFFIFQEIPSFYTILGAGLIVVSSLIIFTRERQLKKAVIMPRQQ